MAFIYVARSAAASKWGSDIGLGKNLFLVAVAPDQASLDADLASEPCGCDDWLLIKKEEIEDSAGDDVLLRLGLKEKMVDPNLYPRLRGRRGLFRVKIENVENHLFVKNALDGIETKQIKIKPKDIAVYLLHNVMKSTKEK